MVPLTKDNDFGNTMNKINELVKSSTTNITDNKHYNDPNIEMLDIGNWEVSYWLQYPQIFLWVLWGNKRCY